MGEESSKFSRQTSKDSNNSGNTPSSDDEGGDGGSNSSKQHQPPMSTTVKETTTSLPTLSSSSRVGVGGGGTPTQESVLVTTSHHAHHYRHHPEPKHHQQHQPHHDDAESQRKGVNRPEEKSLTSILTTTTDATRLMTDTTTNSNRSSSQTTQVVNPCSQDDDIKIAQEGDEGEQEDAVILKRHRRVKFDVRPCFLTREPSDTTDEEEDSEAESLPTVHIIKPPSASPAEASVSVSFNTRKNRSPRPNKIVTFANTTDNDEGSSLIPILPPQITTTSKSTPSVIPPKTVDTSSSSFSRVATSLATLTTTASTTITGTVTSSTTHDNSRNVAVAGTTASLISPLPSHQSPVPPTSTATPATLVNNITGTYTPQSLHILPSNASCQQQQPVLQFEDPDKSPDGRFLKFEEIGRGSFKTVYKGLDTETGVDVAWCELKEWLNKSERQRFREEVEMLKNLQHPNIVRFYDYWEVQHPKRKYLVLITELMSSGTLKSYLRKLKKVNTKVIRSWSRQILKGLQFLHSRTPPIIHRDLKCDNIFITGTTGCVKIGDLGLATLKTRSFAKSVIGTPEFMAPEMYEEHYDEAVDVYSFGMCILEMATSEYPYSECSGPAQIYKKVTSGIPPANFAKVDDPVLKDIIGRCISVKKEDRPSIKELLSEEFLMEDTGIKIEYVDRDETLENHNDPCVKLWLRIIDPKKRRDKHRENEAVEFTFTIGKDDSQEVAHALFEAGYLMEEDVRTTAQLINNQINLVNRERDRKLKALEGENERLKQLELEQEAISRTNQSSIQSNASDAPHLRSERMANIEQELEAIFSHSSKKNSSVNQPLSTVPVSCSAIPTHQSSIPPQLPQPSFQQQSTVNNHQPATHQHHTQSFSTIHPPSVINHGTGAFNVGNINNSNGGNNTAVQRLPSATVVTNGGQNNGRPQTEQSQQHQYPEAVSSVNSLANQAASSSLLSLSAEDNSNTTNSHPHQQLQVVVEVNGNGNMVNGVGGGEVQQENNAVCSRCSSPMSTPASRGSSPRCLSPAIVSQNSSSQQPQQQTTSGGNDNLGGGNKGSVLPNGASGVPSIASSSQQQAPPPS